MKGMGTIMRQAQKHIGKMQKQIEDAQESLREQIVEGSSGGGMVVAKANGQQQLLSVKIDPQVLDPDDVEMIEDLVVAAVNQAMQKAQELYQQEFGKIAGGLNIPGIPGLGNLANLF